MKRVFTLALGLGAGLVIGAYVVRRLDDASRAMAPTSLAGQAGRAAGNLAEQARAALEQGRLAAADREGELRGQYEVPRVRDALHGSDRPAPS